MTPPSDEPPLVLGVWKICCLSTLHRKSENHASLKYIVYLKNLSKFHMVPPMKNVIFFRIFIWSPLIKNLNFFRISIWSPLWKVYTFQTFNTVSLHYQCINHSCLHDKYKIFKFISAILTASRRPYLDFVGLSSYPTSERRITLDSRRSAKHFIIRTNS